MVRMVVTMVMTVIATAKFSKSSFITTRCPRALRGGVLACPILHQRRIAEEGPRRLTSICVRVASESAFEFERGSIILLMSWVSWGRGVLLLKGF